MRKSQGYPLTRSSVSTGYGQPSTAVYEPQGSQDTPRIFDGPPELIVRYEIEKRADQVTKTLYSSSELEEQQTVMAELESGALKQLKIQYDKDFSCKPAISSNMSAHTVLGTNCSLSL